jgi:hypothetical protein
VTLIALLMLTCAASFAQDDALLFHADFDGDLAADYSIGDAPVTVNGEPRVVEGRVGQAVVVGGDNWLSYPSATTLNAPQGTVEFWLMPVNWDGRDDQRSHFFVGAQGADRIYIYKFIRWRHFTFHCNPAHAPHYESLRAGIYTWQTGEWHHAAVTWDRATMRIYLDGELKSEASMPAPVDDLGDALFVGKDLATPQFEHGETAIDELRVYNRPLFPEEVKRAYARADNPDATAEAYQDLIIYYTGYPSKHRAELAFVSSVAVPEGGAALLTITDPATGREAIHESVPSDARGLLAVCDIDTSDLTPAEYDVTVRISDAAGNMLLERTRKLIIRDRFWKREPAGIATEVPPLWTPLEVAGNTVRCWGREYRLGDAGGIGPIQSRGEALLTRPLGLKLTGETRATDWKLVEQTALAVIFECELEAGEARIMQRATIEFDGFVRLDYSIPAGTQLNALTFEIPLRPEVAKYMQTATQKAVNYDPRRVVVGVRRLQPVRRRRGSRHLPGAGGRRALAQSGSAHPA